MKVEDPGEPRRPVRVHSRRIVLVVGVVAVLFVALIGALYYSQQTSAPAHLQVQVAVSPTTGSPQTTFYADIWETNTFDHNNTASVASSWPIQNLSMFSCVRDWPTAFELLEGHDTAQNFSQAQVVPYPYGWFCPLGTPVLRSLTFLPHNSTAVITTTAGVSNRDIYLALTYDNMSVGQYTVVAADMWGHVSFAFFTVSP